MVSNGSTLVILVGHDDDNDCGGGRMICSVSDCGLQTQFIDDDVMAVVVSSMAVVKLERVPNRAAVSSDGKVEVFMIITYSIIVKCRG